MEKVKYYKKIFMTPGIVNYENDEDGVILIKKETIDEALQSFKQKPVIITHDGKEEVGEVVDCYYNVDKGAFVCGFNIWNEEAQQLLDNELFSISCTYKILERGEGGKYHNIDYNTEATKIYFKNLAVVENPRYQEAKEYINSLENIQENGGAGSGNWGHSGRKGKVGGSAKDTGKTTQHQKERRAYGRRLRQLSEAFNADNIGKNFKKKIEKIKEERQKQVSGKMIEKYYGSDNYHKGDNRRTWKMKEKEMKKAKDPNYSPEFETLITTPRGAKLIKNDGKVAWVQSRMIRADGTLTKGGIQALNNGISEEAYNLHQKARENKIEIAKQQKEKQKEILKNNYGYDIDRDESDEAFKTMKKNIISKYGVETLNEIKHINFKTPENIKNILKNDASARFEANYWQTPSGDKKRIYFNVFNSKGYKYPLTNDYLIIE